MKKVFQTRTSKDNGNCAQAVIVQPTYIKKYTKKATVFSILWLCHKGSVYLYSQTLKI